MCMQNEPYRPAVLKMPKQPSGIGSCGIIVAATLVHQATPDWPVWVSDKKGGEGGFWRSCSSFSHAENHQMQGIGGWG